MKNLYIFAILFVFIACKSPTELLESGHHNTAFTKAVSQIKKNKNVEENVRVVQSAAKIKAEKAMLYSSIYANTDKVKDWVKTQRKLYNLLEEMGQANILVKGLITEDYDQVCTEKKNLDYQIVEHFYDEGHDHLDRYYHDGQKEDARLAYKSFKECEKHEGEKFFQRLPEETNEAYQNGIVYYTSNYGNLGSKLFLKHLPKDAAFEPDCEVYVDHGFVSFSTSENTSSETQTQEIETGSESVTDTSGITTRTPIYETVSAEIITKEITITASLSTYVHVKNVTDQCNLRSYSFNTEASDSYQEVSVSGDERALFHHVNESSGEPPTLRDKLEDKVIDEAESEVGY
ncbi:MAG: hypothetical protein AAGA77_22765 [Bacteroidota bacterium]